MNDTRYFLWGITILIVAISLYLNEQFGGLAVVIVYIINVIAFIVISGLLKKLLHNQITINNKNMQFQNITISLISIGIGGIVGLGLFHIISKAIVIGYSNVFSDKKFFFMIVIMLLFLAVFELLFYLYYNFKNDEDLPEKWR